MKRLWLLCGLAALTIGCAKFPPATSQPVMIPPPRVPSTLPKESLGELLSIARQSEAEDKLANAIDALEQAVMHDPEHRIVLLTLSRLTHRHATSLIESDPAQSYRLMVQAGGYLRMFRAAHKDLSDEEKLIVVEIFYGEACSHGRSDRIEETMSCLRDAIGAGFRDLDRLRTEPALDKFRGLAEFDRLQSGLAPKSPPASSP